MTLHHRDVFASGPWVAADPSPTCAGSFANISPMGITWACCSDCGSRVRFQAGNPTLLAHFRGKPREQVAAPVPA